MQISTTRAIESASLESLQNASLEQNQARLKELIFADGEHLSFSQINTYLRCPRQYLYKYVRLETPQHVSDHLVFGNAIHRAVAGFYSHFKDTGEHLHHDKLLSDFRTILDNACQESRYPILWGKGRDRAQFQNLGRKMLTVFAKEVKPGRVVAVELPFSIEICDPRTGEVLPPLVGAVDLLELDENGRLVLGELKTAGSKWSELDVEQNIQASLYSLVLCELGLAAAEDDAVRVRIDVLTKAKSPKFSQHDTVRGSWDRQRALGIIASVHQRAIQATAFHPTPSWMCLGCPFRKTCDGEP